MRIAMTLLRALSVILLVVGCSTATHAEPVFPDKLLDAYVRAGKSMSAGGKREDALAQLKVAIEQHSESRYSALARRLASDIATSIEQAAARANSGRTLDEAPAEFLSGTTMPLYLLAHPSNWEQALPKFMEAAPRDPAVLLLRLDRKCIDSLLRQLGNDSPTRSFQGFEFSGIPAIPRVCDVALGLIEKTSGCKFHFNASSGELFHQLGSAKREEITSRMLNWWRVNKERSVAEGIRDQLAHGDFYAQITMAENLVRLAGKESAQDREYGLEVLRRSARSGADYHGAYAARVLEKFGDLSPVEWYYSELKKSLNVPGRYFSMSIPALFYLAEHGERKEWELLLEIALKDLERERLSKSGERAFVLGSLLNSKEAATSPYAIPLLGAALSRTQKTGSRYINEQVGSRSFSTADTAAENLQQLAGQDFGYQRAGADKERAAAIEQAQKWWQETGRAKYTFDYIERNMAQRRAAKDRAR